MCTVVADGYLPFLFYPDFQLYNKIDYSTTGCFMAMPFPYSVIQKVKRGTSLNNSISFSPVSL